MENKLEHEKYLEAKKFVEEYENKCFNEAFKYRNSLRDKLLYELRKDDPSLTEETFDWCIERLKHIYNKENQAKEMDKNLKNTL